MRAIIQRVKHARVVVDGCVTGSCEEGLLILLGVGATDTRAQAEKLWSKISRLRIFADDAGKTNLSIADVGGGVCIVSQFTLYASCRKGNRPSFTDAATPALAEELYEYVCELAQRDVAHVGRGVFGAMMDVELVNDGPFTVWLDTDEL
ncbi:MAG: D-tyrosyl-tRNA(Tyr) deacylase [Atopobiaceae bacterium]|nr:D-tyrosyl-tRNA(Tyr) deacylase [Atopobiaceae bacterium]